MRVRVTIRLPHPYLSHRDIIDPEPSPGPLVAGADLDLAGHPGREGQGPDFPELVREQIFVKGIRADGVPHDPDLHVHRVPRLEKMEIVHEVRVVRILLPPVAHLFSELFLLRLRSLQGCGMHVSVVPYLEMEKKCD